MPEARSIPFWSPEEAEASLGATIAHLQAGGILAYPTETVYGFGTMIDREAVDRLVALKRRPPAKPFLLLISDTPMLQRIGLHLTRSASMLAAHFSPGPMTLVLPGGERRVPDRLRGPEGGIAGPEAELLAAAGAQRVRLGPTVLRTSLAGAAAVAVLSARQRWRSIHVTGGLAPSMGG